jgi:hypothetical protein
MANEKTVSASRPRRAAGSRRRSSPEIVAPTNRINVALPFAHLQVEEPSQDLAELAHILAELAAVVADLAPTSTAKDLRARAEALTPTYRASQPALARPRGSRPRARHSASPGANR